MEKLSKMDNIKLTLQELNVLSVLDSREMYGYEIVKTLNEGNTFFNQILLGSLYNILKQLSRKKLVTSRWGEEDTTNGARRRYYSITADGSMVLNEARDYYLQLWKIIPNNV